MKQSATQSTYNKNCKNYAYYGKCELEKFITSIMSNLLKDYCDDSHEDDDDDGSGGNVGG